MKNDLLNMPRRRNVEEVLGEPEYRLLLLRRDEPVTLSENGIISGLSNEAISLINEKGGELKRHSLKVLYGCTLSTSSLLNFIIHLNI